eukprot:TRINITY_DN28171_c0_g1_i1.p1 TRINITY_DN28171_c0_g1~~TRINITY_DN28171_c0_g1_i1.p1  ORF type:complete len:114 (-),score=12.59 TRINITY_DN28171_c0_g1_i1:274-615(-)
MLSSKKKSRRASECNIEHNHSFIPSSTQCYAASKEGADWDLELATNLVDLLLNVFTAPKPFISLIVNINPFLLPFTNFNLYALCDIYLTSNDVEITSLYSSKWFPSGLHHRSL